ncbi:glycoside hydrolase family protein [Pseudoalteromonas marina]|uniref:glycoside hydrolase family protein n=1 Tax=Pseudoalteromonas marina TaxID=267375 RepID=UPI0023F26427|nr:glycoside hydrolase family protein [Pseudoalteromonas marina]
MNKSKLAEQLKKHEGLRLKPYTDTVGKLTLGIGRNLEDKGITEQEALFMLNNDVDYFYGQLNKKLTWFKSLDDARQNVLVNMAFNLGVAGLLSFVNTLSAISYSHYSQASREMLNSKWAKQVGYRAEELAEQMRTGEYQ